jgi:hypothetical protein
MGGDRARPVARGRNRPYRLVDIVLALFGAAGMYAKLSTAVFLLSGIVWFFSTSTGAACSRRACVALFAAAMLPLADWLIKSGFSSFQYAPFNMP